MTFTEPAGKGIQQGAFVEVRGRSWLVEAVDDAQPDLPTIRLSCIADDAQGEQIEVLWDAELGAKVLDEDSWSRVGRGAPDSPEVLAAHLRAVRWHSATAADRDLLQAPFRAGIRLDAYQLLPLRKALRLPRVNLLIADDVGLGKTVEAGLIVRELLLRRRIDLMVISAPAAMTRQWKDELESKFGLTFDIIDRMRIGELRRLRGFNVNPWTTGSRFIISQSLLSEEEYIAGLRDDVLGEFRSRALFILDEAHHAAPSGGARYAIASQLTRAVRELAGRFEHRLFLTATPHNGHSNSFSALLEMLDPQRFTRGVDISPKDLEPVMVRRLKLDLRRLGEAFPERMVEAIPIAGLPDDTPELDLWGRLASYGELRKRRIATLPPEKAALAKLAFVGLQQRLLSSIPAFLRTLKAHRKSLQRLIDGGEAQIVSVAAKAFVDGTATAKTEDLGLEDEQAEQTIDADEEATAEAATIAGAAGASTGNLAGELAVVDAMIAHAERVALRPDARVRWLVEWIKSNQLSDSHWSERRLIIFTEWEDTRRWLEKRLREALADTDQADERIAVFTGTTEQDRREEVKAAFNADPAKEPLRILICTDAAREGINLQTYCKDLVHFDLPWNPSRLEQRNGRIDRKLQAAKQVFCRYFRYEQREADIVLDALVRKTEVIQNQLGSAGQVIEKRIAARLAEGGIDRGAAMALAKSIEEESDVDRLTRARAEMDDEERARFERTVKEQEELQGSLEKSRERVGVDPHDLERVVGAALARAGLSLDRARGETVGRVVTFRLDPNDPAFAKEPGWQDTFDDLRARPRKRRERLNEWRNRAPIRAIAFEAPRLANGGDAPEVVQVHLEHRLVRRLLSRFLSQGFQSSLSRIAVIEGPGAQPRVVLMGRLAVYGAWATRLHEEVIPITAIWTEAERQRRPLRALGDSGEERTLTQLEQALRDARAAPANAVARIQSLVERDIADLLPTLEHIAAKRLDAVTGQLAKRGEAEARLLRELLERQRSRIAKASAEFDPNQLLLPGIGDEERRERESDRRHWQGRLLRLEQEILDEPERIRASYDVRAHRLDPVGLVYLWPSSG
jgi:superfamily II DNA or RNA helicase